MVPVAILWRRLDVPGHDACRLEEQDGGWRLEGVAVGREVDAASCVRYRLECDRAWRTRRGRVRGWIGPRSIEFDIERTARGAWTLNGIDVPHLEDCVDLDFGFTPATNLPTLRRLALAPGQAADVSVAWFDVASGSLTALPQRYERRTESTYWYESPQHSYAALLQVTPGGFTRDYPGLWVMED